MQNWDYPPYPYLELVLRICPRAGLIYLKLWNERDKYDSVVIFRDQVKTKFLMKTSMFLEKLMLLASEGLVCVEEHPNLLRIELTGWDDEDTYASFMP